MDSVEALHRVRDLVHSPQADQFRAEACRDEVGLPYANNRYVRLLDDVRAVLREAGVEEPTR